MTDLQDAIGGVCLQMLRVDVNTLEKQSLIAEKGVVLQLAGWARNKQITTGKSNCYVMLRRASDLERSFGMT
jgi:hypothetical protein